MKPVKIRVNTRPEAKIQKAIIAYMRNLEWLVKPTHGNAFQSGFPDLYCHHIKYGQRWVEVKNPSKYAFTKAQCEWFPQFAAAGCGIWILTAATKFEYDKLMRPANWHTYISEWRKA